MTVLKNSFTLSKIDDVNLKKYNLTLKELKEDIKKLADILLNLKEIQNKKIFNEKIKKIKFDVCLCNDKTIHQINKEYRNKDKATDVITFALFFDDENSLIYRSCAELGEIIVSLETADKQKEENKNTLKKEVLTLICHGILHLIGFDHLTKKDYDFVVGIQNKVMENYE